MSFASNVKEALRVKQITQNELARAANISSSGISYALRENGNPSLATMEAIADALGADLAELMSGGKAASAVDMEERLLLAYFRRLNPEGRARLLEQAEDLAAREKYTQEKSSRIG